MAPLYTLPLNDIQYDSTINNPHPHDIQIDRVRIDTEIKSLNKTLKKVLDEVQVHKYNYFFPKAIRQIVCNMEVIWNGLLANDEILQQELINLWYEIDALKTRVTNLELRMDAAEAAIATLQSQVSTLETQVTTLDSQVTNLDIRTTATETAIATLQSDVSLLQANSHNHP